MAETEQELRRGVQQVLLTIAQYVEENVEPDYAVLRMAEDGIDHIVHDSFSECGSF